MEDFILRIVLLSFIHVVILFHWIPIVLIGKAEKWSKKEIICATIIIGCTHSFSITVFTILLRSIDPNVSKQYSITPGVHASLLLVCIGVIYFLLNFNQKSNKKYLFKKSIYSIVFTLCIIMAVSPIWENESIVILNETWSWFLVLIASMIYLVCTLTGMLFLVAIAFKLLEKYSWHIIEQREKKLMPLVLISIGILSFFAQL